MKELLNKIFSKKLINLVLGIVLLLSAFSVNAGKLDKVRAGIEQTKQFLKEEEAIHQKEKQQASITQKSLEDRIETLERKIDRVQKETNELEEKINSTTTEKNRLMKKVNKINSFITEVKNFLVVSASNLYETIHDEFSYDLDSRLRKIDSFKKQLEGKDVDIPGSLDEFWYYFDKEINLGYDSEIYSDEVETKNGEMKKAEYLRIGKVILAYRTNDNTESGMLCKNKNNYEWNKDIRGNTKKSIRKAIEIMQGKRIPHLIEFPVSFDYSRYRK